MLKTSDEHEIDAYPLGYGDGVKMWHAVTFELPTPYFFVFHAIKVGKAWLHETCVLWRKADVLNFCRDVSKDAERKILQVSVLFPADGAKRGCMEDIKEIWHDAGAENGQAAMFVALDGRQLARSSIAKRASFPMEMERVFCLSRSCA